MSSFRTEFVHATHKGVIWREKQRRTRTPIKVNDATQKRRENFHEQTEREKNDNNFFLSLCRRAVSFPPNRFEGGNVNFLAPIALRFEKSCFYPDRGPEIHSFYVNCQPFDILSARMRQPERKKVLKVPLLNFQLAIFRCDT